MNLDHLAAIGCGWVALILFGLHTLSSPRLASWMTIPGYVRGGFWITGAMFMWRAVNFATLPPDHLGHVNREGLMALVTLIYTVTALAVWVARMRLPDHGWARLEWIRALMQRRPGIVPAPMTLAEVAAMHTDRGAIVSTPPADGADALGRRGGC